MKPADAEPSRRTAWNCVDCPGEGMHYAPGKNGCLWCGMTQSQIRIELDNMTEERK